MTPGAGTGADSPGVTHPAFPAEAPSPQRLRSITVTSAPRRASDHAEARPITPPPITATLTTQMVSAAQGAQFVGSDERPRRALSSRTRGRPARASGAGAR